ncbi:MAG: nucleotidyltransferase, partial [Spirochaetae bacterium HGW-Spirochaetae-6]
MKGIIVAAGYGTRFLPITKTIPKEMLPLINRPALDFIVEEMMEAGIRDILIITHRKKKSLEDFFDRDPELEGGFGAGKALDKLAKI